MELPMLRKVLSLIPKSRSPHQERPLVAPTPLPVGPPSTLNLRPVYLPRVSNVPVAPTSLKAPAPKRPPAKRQRNYTMGQNIHRPKLILFLHRHPHRNHNATAIHPSPPNVPTPPPVPPPTMKPVPARKCPKEVPPARPSNSARVRLPTSPLPKEVEQQVPPLALRIFLLLRPPRPHLARPRLRVFLPQ